MNDQDFRDHVVGSLATLTAQVSSLDSRLFGSPNGEGAIQYLHNQNTLNANAVTQLQKEKAITTWKLGTTSAFAGAILYGFGNWLKNRLGL